MAFADKMIKREDAQKIEVTFPENVYMNQYDFFNGTKDLSEVPRVQAVYKKRKGKHFVMSAAGSGHARRGVRWNANTGGKILEDGLDFINPILDWCEKEGVSSFMVKHIQGYHMDLSSTWLHGNAMPFYLKNDEDERMVERTREIAEECENRGINFGIYMGTVVAPMRGTYAKPIFNWFTWEDYDYMIYTLRHMVDLGCKEIGLDAFSWFWSRLSQPTGKQWQPPEQIGDTISPPREDNLGLRLLARLTYELPGIRLLPESWAPDPIALILQPSLQLVRSAFDKNPSRVHRPTYDQLPDLTMENLILPGIQRYAMMEGEWPVEDFEAAWGTKWTPGRFEEKGYTPSVNYWMLRDMGIF